MGAGSLCTDEKPGCTFIESLPDGAEMPAFELIADSFRHFMEFDGLVKDYIDIFLEVKYPLMEEEMRELVHCYFVNSRETSSFLHKLQNSLVDARIDKRKIGVAVQGITPETPLSDAQYMKIKEKFMDHKRAENPFKDFEQNLKPLLKRHEQLLKKSENKMKEVEKEELQMEELHQQLLNNKTEEELKPKSGSKNWIVWKAISVATVAAMVALSVAAVVLVPGAPLLQLAPAFCTMCCSVALTVCAKPAKDKIVENIEAEDKRAEAEKKLTEARKKLTEAKNIIKTVYWSTSGTMRTLDEAECSEEGLIVVSNAIDRYIDQCLEAKENVPLYAEDIRKEQKNFIDKLDRLREDVDQYCSGLHERREALIRKLNSYN